MSRMILVYGTVCMDRIHRINSLPLPGQYREIQSQTVVPGGEALNTYQGLIKLGANAKLEGNPIDLDAAQMFAEHGIRYPNVAADAETPVCEIFVTPDGQRTMMGFRFADLERVCRPDEVDLTGHSILTIDSNIAQAGVAMARRAIEAQILTYVMDLWPAEIGLGERDMWQCSARSRGVGGDRNAILAMIDGLEFREETNIIVTDGGHGVYLAEPSYEVRHLPPYLAAQIVDTTGAGDAFRAGTLWGLSQGLSLRQAIGIGSATGMMKTRGEGALGGLATAAEIAELQKNQADVTAVYNEAS